LFVEAGAGETAVLRGWLEVFGGVFGEDEGVGGEDGGVGGAAEEAEGLGVGVFVVVGWVEEDDVEGIELEQACEQGGGSAVFEGVVAGDGEVGEVGFEGFEGGRSFFGEEGVGCPAGDGLDADGTGSGEEVGEATAFDARTEDVEEGFAEAVAGGAGQGAGWGGEGSGTEGSGDDAHTSMVWENGVRRIQSKV
jgi:hypothetical protein